MMTITSPAGRRLAKARVEYARADAAMRCAESHEETSQLTAERRKARLAFEEAAFEVGDELVTQQFHLMEGD